MVYDRQTDVFNNNNNNNSNNSNNNNHAPLSTSLTGGPALQFSSV